jgi:hypothetical protein
MGRYMVGLVALDLVLRIFFGGMSPVALVVEVAGVDCPDRPAYPAGFRIPGHMVADLEFLRHFELLEFCSTGTQPGTGGIGSLKRVAIFQIRSIRFKFLILRMS